VQNLAEKFRKKIEKNREEGLAMENKKEIVKALKEVLVFTRAGENISDLVLSKNQDTVTVFYKMDISKQ